MSWIREQFTFQDLQRLLFKLAEKVKAFQGLKPVEIAEVLASAEKCTFQPGMPIIKEGSVGTHMYIIIEGEAIVTKRGRDGDVELARLRAADSFGEMALMDNEARSATVAALTPCVLVRLGNQAIEATPSIAMRVYHNIARVLTERLRTTNDLVVWRL
jgi:CRP-like cAMP-binding protein